MKRRPRIEAAAVSLAAILTFATVRYAAAAGFEKTIPVPRTARTNLNWNSGGCAILGVSLQNYPNEEDIEKARNRDPKDNSWVWWNFSVENRGDTKCKISLAVEIYDKSGNVLKSSDRSDTIDPHKFDDNIRLSTRMRTLDIVDAPKAKIKADIAPK